MTTGEFLADMMDNTRRLTKWYLKTLDKSHWHIRPTFNNQKLNSPYWLIGHLVWADQFLCLEALNPNFKPIEWTKAFGFNTSGDVENGPDIDVLINTFNEIHDQKTILCEKFR